LVRIIDILPQLELAEVDYIQTLIANMSDEDARRFAGAYSIRRRDSSTMLLLALLGFLWIAGIHRFVLGQVGMGVLYLLTVGFCYIGTIIDLVNIKQMTATYNMQVAHEVALMMK
jgi:TM2 domain-containing membrane protein YozV